MKVNKEVHYNQSVSVNVEMDKLRKTECLCLNCGNLPACNKAEDLYKICIDHDMAMMITRCKSFVND